MYEIKLNKQDNSITLKQKKSDIKLTQINKNISLKQIGRQGQRGEDGLIQSIVPGSNITVDSTDPANPIVSSTGGGAVDSVNGQVGVVVLDSTDVGADPAGSAAQALVDAKQYTDNEVSGIDTGVLSVVAGTNVAIDDTDPKNPIVNASGGGGSGIVESVVAGDNVAVDSTDPANPVVSSTQSYSEFVYNTTGNGADNVYTNFPDLYVALQAQAGYKRVVFEEPIVYLDDTGMPSEGWNLDDVTFVGRTPSALGGTIIAFIGGFKTTGWNGGGIIVAGAINGSSQPIIERTEGIHLFQMTGALIRSINGGQPVFKYSGSAIGLISMGAGSVLGEEAGDYSAVVVEASGAATIIPMNSSSTEIASTALAGSGYTSLVIQDASVIPDMYTRTFPNHTGYIDRQLSANSAIIQHNSTTVKAELETLASSISSKGDMFKSIYDPANGNRQVAFADSIPKYVGTLSAGSGGINLQGGGTTTFAAYAATPGDTLLIRTPGTFNFGNGDITVAAGQLMFKIGVSGGASPFAVNSWIPIT